MKPFHYLLCFSFFVLPFHRIFLSFEVGFLTLNPYLLGILISFVLIFAHHLFSTEKFNFTMLDLMILLFCLSFLASTFLSKDVVRSGQMAYRAIFIPVISYCVMKFSIKNDLQFKRILFSLVFGIIFMAVIGLIQMKLNPVRRDLFGLGPVNTASFLFIPLVIIIYLGWWKKLLGFICFCICLVLFFMTYSRLYYLGLLLSPFIYLLIRKGHLFKFYLLIFPFFMLVFVSLSFYQGSVRHEYVANKELRTINRVLKIDIYKKAFAQRAWQYRQGVEDFLKHPALGTGIKPGRVNITTHNFHIEWLQYGGIIGTSVGMAMFFVFFLMNRFQPKNNHHIASLLCIFIVILFNCTTNGIMHGYRHIIIFSIMGMIEAHRIINTQENADVITLE